MSTNEIHEEKNTFQVDVNIPGHDPRTATPLFEKSRKHLLERDGGRCWVCNCTAEETGHPIEAHHYPIERSFAEMIDWAPAGTVHTETYALGEVDESGKPLVGNYTWVSIGQIRKDFPNFGWGSFDESNPYTFVDDMNVNGRLLCKKHHIGKDEGVHDLPEPVWIAQRYGKDGYKFSNVEIIHHDQGDSK